MTTIIDYVVLNETFYSTIINLVNLDSSVFCLMVPWRATTERSTFLTSLFIWFGWYDPMENIHPYTGKYRRIQINVLSQIWPQFCIVQGRM